MIKKEKLYIYTKGRFKVKIFHEAFSYKYYDFYYIERIDGKALFYHPFWTLKEYLIEFNELSKLLYL